MKIKIISKPNQKLKYFAPNFNTEGVDEDDYEYIYTAKIFFLPDMLRTALQIQFLITITITKKELLNLNLKVLIMNFPVKIVMEVLNYGVYMKELKSLQMNLILTGIIVNL